MNNSPFTVSKADLSSQPQACISSCLPWSFSPLATRPLKIMRLLLISPLNLFQKFPHLITTLRVIPDAAPPPHVHIYYQVLF